MTKRVRFDDNITIIYIKKNRRKISFITFIKKYLLCF